MNVSILGSTGSIGTQTLDVIREHPEDFHVTSMACGKNVKLIEEQARIFRPDFIAVRDEEDAHGLRIALRDLSIPCYAGMDGLIRTAEDPRSELLVTGIVGMLGIRPTIAAIRAGKDIALANKETLVCAGHLIMPLAEECGVRILPVDSEHSAIFQSLQGNTGNRIHKIILTASGGPFRGKKRQEILDAEKEDVLRNPNWNMGAKVTVDSADMVNKGLECMEAGWLFGVGRDRIEVVVHPQSVLHSAVEYEDGAVIGQLGVPDMRIPIQYALEYPSRPALSGKRLSLTEIGKLTFEKPDTDTFPGLALAWHAMDAGGNLPVVFNAADEAAVRLFLDGKIRFGAITDLIGEAMASCGRTEAPDLDGIFDAEKETKETVLRLAGIS